MKSPKTIVVACAILLTASIAASTLAQLLPPGNQRQPQPQPQPQPNPAPLPNPAPTLDFSGFGLALSGLPQTLLNAFNDSKVEFTNIETPASGLGPIFNGRSCAECHSVPTLGGSSRITVTRFGRSTDDKFDALESLGGSLLQRFAIDREVQEHIPAEANVIAQRESTALFGAGLIEAIPDSAIVQNAALLKGDGVQGRAAEIIDVTTSQKRIGRFGWKAQQATLLAFSGDAYLNEMGITNRFFPHENAPNGNTTLLARFKRTTDPEDQVDPVTGKGDIDVVADFMRLLAPPPRLTMNASAAGGEVLFTQAGCAACHTPSMRTGSNAIAALDRKVVNLYSDLLLHDMGSLNDGIAQAAASAKEMKTAPLWGLRTSAPYLHDGRATTVDAAIRAHDGEAAVTRDRYLRLSPALRQQLQDFLGTL